MPLAVLDPPDHARLVHELDLRAQALVAVTAPDALFPSFANLLPRCAVRQAPPEPRAAKVVWSHPGRSGLDPRAVAPLAIVRVADSLGPDPLDAPLTLLQAARWLLDGDITDWLLRAQHRLLLTDERVTCMLQDDQCRTHPAADALLQQVATALGDTSADHCHALDATSSAGAWAGAGEDLTAPLRGARAVLDRLAGWYRTGVTGTPAWELARYGHHAADVDQWRRAGFTVAEASVWCGRGGPVAAARLRDRGEQPVQPVATVLLPVAAPERGLSGFDRWQYSRRKWPFAPCPLCGASAPAGKRCRTCEQHGRTTPLRRGDWALYQRLAELGPAYAPPGRVSRPVRCGERNCQTPLALSPSDEGVRL